MKEDKVEKGEIVQLGPAVKNPMFTGCLMIVTDPKTWGCQGFVQALGENGKMGGQAYYRATWEEMERTHGVAVFMPAYEMEDDEE